jgi:hypothetical protein
MIRTSLNSSRTAIYCSTADVAYMIQEDTLYGLEVMFTPHGPWTHVGVCWVHACLTMPLEGPITISEQIRNRTTTVFEQSNTAEVAYMI